MKWKTFSLKPRNFEDINLYIKPAGFDFLLPTKTFQFLLQLLDTSQENCSQHFMSKGYYSEIT
jgi:hypothetical protein